MRIAVVGATGLVGQRLIRYLLREPAFAGAEILPFASERSAGGELTVEGQPFTVLSTAELSAHAPYEVAFTAVGDQLSRTLVPELREMSRVVIDKSRTFRLDPEVPLVVAGVNDHALREHRGLVANPNCSTIELCHLLGPLRELSPTRVLVATYQSVSGAGQQALVRFHRELDQIAHARDLDEKVLSPEMLAANLIPQIGHLEEEGYASEEEKLSEESKKILSLPHLRVEATAVRVPVFVGHAMAVTVEFARPADPAEVERLLRASPHIRYFPQAGDALPSPLTAATHDQVEVGRLRPSRVFAGGVSLFACADNLGIGAALNGVRIARALVREGQAVGGESDG